MSLARCTTKLQAAATAILYCLLVYVYFVDSRRIIISSKSNCTKAYQECFSLSKLYVGNPDGVELTSNTTITFPNGVHILKSSIIIRDVMDLTLTFETESKLHCENRSGLAFVNITNLQLIGLTMSNCGAEISESLVQDALYIQTETVLMLEFGIKAAIFAVSIRNLYMNQVKVNGSHGYGFLGINIIGNSFVTDSLINSSNFNSLTDYCTHSKVTVSDAAECLGGNALFVYNDFPQCPETTEFHNLMISNSTLSNGLDPLGGSPSYISRGAGLGVIMSQRYYDVHVKVISSVIDSNRARAFGSNLYFRILFSVTKSTVSIYNCNIAHGRCLYCNIPRGIPYSSLVFVYGPRVPSSQGKYKQCSNIDDTASDKNMAISQAEKPRQQILLIKHSKFYNNHGGAIYVVFFSNLTHLQRYSVLIQNCTLSKNEAAKTGAMYIADISPKPENTKELEMSVEETIFEGHMTLTEPYIDSQPNTNLLLRIKNFTFRSCTFKDNDASAIVALDTSIHFEGENAFQNNRARLGGALHLTAQSILYLRPNVQMIFENNSAMEKGGALHITEGSDDAYYIDCPIQVFDPTFTEISQLNISLMFVNNSAREAGDALYGGRIDACYTAAPSQFLRHNRTLTRSLTFDNITDFTHQPTTNSLISSDAIKVCFCYAGRHNCSLKHWTLSKYPGEEFGISVVGVGQREGTVPAVVLAYSLTHHLKNSSHQTGKVCTDTYYTVESNSSMFVDLFLAPNAVMSNYHSSLQATVNLLKCDSLTGFTLNKNLGTCTCLVQLEERNISCNINTKMIVRQPPYWLGNYSNHLLLHDNCPYDYCKTTPVEITMTEPNISKQCAFDRYGTLCGSCREGFSHVFGSSRCLKCSNTHLLLVLPFALAGIGLVIFLFTLNLTVSVGTINGLIFYANIIKINETIFYPLAESRIYRIFISWINLDLGIETCFYNGMDSLVKTSLQFAFPFYLWAIVGLLIVMFRYSARLTKLCGNHSVSVLATVFLLSFTKLLRTIMTVLSLTTLQYPNGLRAVWLYDGNIQYAKNGHLALVLFSFIFLLALGLPYALLILMIQLLRRYSDKWYLHWVNRFMPIFDAYIGPYKHKRGYWTGLLLFVRVVLVVVFAANVSGNPAINIFVVTVTAIFLIALNLGQGGVYKHAFLTFLEISHVVNLGILAAATGLVRQTDGQQTPAIIYTSTTIALVMFIGTLVYHTKLQIEKMNCIQQLKMGKSKPPPESVTESIYVQFEDSEFGVRRYVSKKNTTVTSTIIEGICENDNN